MIKIARKKPVEVEVCQWTGDNPEEMMEFCGKAAHDIYQINLANMPVQYSLVIHTLEGDHRANIGDYIIKGVHGEFYPCKEEIFYKTYDIIG